MKIYCLIKNDHCDYDERMGSGDVYKIDSWYFFKKENLMKKLEKELKEEQVKDIKNCIKEKQYLDLGNVGFVITTIKTED
jgi:hypothetical protein